MNYLYKLHRDLLPIVCDYLMPFEVDFLRIALPSLPIKLDDYNINYPWKYEQFGILGYRHTIAQQFGITIQIYIKPEKADLTLSYLLYILQCNAFMCNMDHNGYTGKECEITIAVEDLFPIRINNDSDEDYLSDGDYQDVD